jgi:hypothetical protein
MPDQIAKRNADLPTLGGRSLRLMEATVRCVCAPKLRRDLMIPILAYRLQELPLDLSAQVIVAASSSSTHPAITPLAW